MSTMIAKLQKSLATSDGETRLLTKIDIREEPFPENIQILFDHSRWGPNKVYVEVVVRNGDIEIRGFAPRETNW